MYPCPRCKAKSEVDNIDYTLWECGSTRERFYDGHRSDTYYALVCEDPDEEE